MLSEDQILKQLPHVLARTEFNFLGQRYEGKVRDNYIQGSTRYLITSDRLSCFDVVVTTVPFKGKVLNDLAVFWFERSKQIIPNHVLNVPHPNVLVVKNCEILPVEVVVRAYLTGSAWRDYASGRTVSGITLPPGLKSNQKLAEPIITPSTKAAKGSHDEPISETEILSRGLVSSKLWQQVRTTALALFELGATFAQSRGLILVDTKYEFGLYQGELILADEIHTLDSSRYWEASSYPERFEQGESPQMLDKEPTRQWLLSQGFKGDGPIPDFTPEHRVAIAKHYIDSYERVTGKVFEANPGPVVSEIEAVLSTAAQ